jgi:hypothetical protein
MRGGVGPDDLAPAHEAGREEIERRSAPWNLNARTRLTVALRDRSREGTGEEERTRERGRDVCARCEPPPPAQCRPLARAVTQEGSGDHRRD